MKKQTKKHQKRNPLKSFRWFSRPFLSVHQPFFPTTFFFYNPFLSCLLPLLTPVHCTTLFHHLHTSISLSFRTQLKPLESFFQFPFLKYCTFLSDPITFHLFFSWAFAAFHGILLLFVLSGSPAINTLCL